MASKTLMEEEVEDEINTDLKIHTQVAVEDEINLDLKTHTEEEVEEKVK